MIEGTAIVLQARMGSQRLPGKTLALVAGRTVLDHCIERLQASGLRLVVATTVRAEDDQVAEACARASVELMRGPDADVLARYVMVATKLALTDLIRATADNPAVDMDAPRRVLDLRRSTDADYVTETGLPYGTAVEAVSAEALSRSAGMTDDPLDREHVTRFVRRHPRFVAHHAAAPDAVRRPELRLTVDTAEDLAFVRRVFERAERERPRPVPLDALIASAGRLTEAVGH